MQERSRRFVLRKKVRRAGCWLCHPHRYNIVAYSVPAGCRGCWNAHSHIDHIRNFAECNVRAPGAALFTSRADSTHERRVLYFHGEARLRRLRLEEHERFNLQKIVASAPMGIYILRTYTTLMIINVLVTKTGGAYLSQYVLACMRIANG